jgi:DNA-binding transcriptional MerR regulator
MSQYIMRCMMTPASSSPEPTLADLAAASGLEPRTIRSWIAQGLLPPPLTRGPAARYPADTVQRLLAIQAMREVLGMSLADIRMELLVANAEQIAAHAARAADLPRHSGNHKNPGREQASKSALDYIARLRVAEASMPGDSAAPSLHEQQPPAPSGFEALERHLGQGKAVSTRKSRAEEWLRIPVTPDIELSARGPLDPAQRTRLERCADLIRSILLGREP